MTPADRIAALQAEFSRLQGRADVLARIIDGSEDEWLGIQEKLGGSVAEVTINAPLAEARQTALALATIAKTLDALSSGEQSSAPAKNVGDEVSQRRADKLAAAAAKTAQ